MSTAIVETSAAKSNLIVMPAKESNIFSEIPLSFLRESIHDNILALADNISELPCSPATESKLFILLSRFEDYCERAIADCASLPKR